VGENDVTNDTSYNGKLPNFYGIENIVEIQIVCLVKTKFITNGTLYFIKWDFFNDDITLKISIALYYS